MRPTACRAWSKRGMSGVPTERDPAGHPRFALDETIHAPVRLSIMAALANADRRDFAFLRDTIEVSDSLLSKHMSQLESAGYVRAVKKYERGRTRTWFLLTDAGRDAFRTYARAVARLVGEEHAQRSSDDSTHEAQLRRTDER